MDSELQDAFAVSMGLIAYVRSVLPLIITTENGKSDPAIQVQWIPVRMTATLESVFALGRESHHEDAAALVRVMTDHLIVFAWLLGDDRPPERINAWKNNDLRLMRALRSDLDRHGVRLPEPPVDNAPASSWVDMRRAAIECDRFWGPYLRPLFEPDTINSFVGLYSAVFRSTSSYVHPSFRGSMGFFTTPVSGQSGEFYIGESYAVLPGTYVRATLAELLAIWILSARFRHADIPTVLPFVHQVVELVVKWNREDVRSADDFEW
jgi:hypothetical protein